MKIACCQMDIKWEDKKANFIRAENLVSRAVRDNADVICFPELFATGVTQNPKKFYEKNGGETFKFLSSLAEKSKAVIIGSLIEDVHGNPRNTCIVFDSSGKIVSKYHKIHPFTFDGEHKVYEPGDDLVFFKINGVICSAFICYDLRFPEIFRIAAIKGAEICFVIANWPYPRQEHWKAILKARAIENQMFVVGVNRVGDSPTNKYFGFSQVIDPFGNIIAEGKEAEEELVIADVDIDIARNWRKKLPCLKDARYELYKKLSADIK